MPIPTPDLDHGPEATMVEHLLPPQRSMRLSCVTDTYPPEVNGVARTLARLVVGLGERHQVQLVRPRPAVARPAGPPEASTPFTAEVLVRGVPIPRYPQLRMGWPAKQHLLRLWAVQRPDLVHIATEGPLGYSALQAALQLKLPVTSDFRTNFQTYSQHYGVGWLRRPIMAYLRSFHNRCNFTMVPTQPLRQALEAQGFERLVVVPRGVDTQLFCPSRRSLALRAQWGAAPDDLVVACVGRLAHEKNLSLVLRSFGAIQQSQPRARLLLVGDGPLHTALRAQHPQALVVGQQKDLALAEHYASADLFLFASLTETFGNVTAEAMASGLAVLAFDYAAAAQMIDSGQNGCLVPFGDATAFVAQAQHLAGDAALRARCGLKARGRAMTQDWAGIVQQVEALFTQSLVPASAAVLRHDTAAPGLLGVGRGGLQR